MVRIAERAEVLANRSKLKDKVRPKQRKTPKSGSLPGERLAKKPSTRSRWVPQAHLLWRVVEVDRFAGPCCDQRMALRAVVLPPAPLHVLSSLRRSARGPPSAEPMVLSV